MNEATTILTKWREEAPWEPGPHPAAAKMCRDHNATLDRLRTTTALLLTLLSDDAFKMSMPTTARNIGQSIIEAAKGETP